MNSIDRSALSSELFPSKKSRRVSKRRSPTSSWSFRSVRVLIPRRDGYRGIAVNERRFKVGVKPGSTGSIDQSPSSSSASSSSDSSMGIDWGKFGNVAVTCSTVEMNSALKLLVF